MEQFPSLSHLELRLDLAAESGEELGELLMFRVTLKVYKDFHASGFISHIGQANRSEVRVLQGPAFALGRSDGHAQRGAIALPRHDNRSQAALTDRQLLNRAGDGAGGARGHELKKLFTHRDLWYSGPVIEPLDNENVPSAQNGVKRFTHSSGDEAYLITPIKKTRVAEEVADRIRVLMLDGTFPPGEPLPSERHLAERFGVSRGSIRDALRTLETIGLLETRHGQGTFPHELSVDRLVAPLASVMAYRSDLQDELLDVRRMFEPAVARVAALRATEEDLADLQRILETQRQKLKAGQSAIAEDTAFHAILARATRNRVVMSIMATLNDLLVESRTQSLRQKGRPARSIDGHEAVVAALRRRDVEGASQAMYNHIDQIADLHVPTHKGPHPPSK
jgi:GntR family transcriptional regulator, transcriptional repressor for pyruvate dehydrogenase complex